MWLPSDSSQCGYEEVENTFSHKNNPNNFCYYYSPDKMSRLKTIEANGHKIITMDYRGCKEKDMMMAATALKDAIAAEGKPVGVLALFDDKTYVTGAFMRHAEKETAQVIHLVEDSAFVGLSKTKKFILLGYNLLFRKHFKAFDTEEEAIQYLSEKVAVQQQ